MTKRKQKCRGVKLSAQFFFSQAPGHPKRWNRAEQGLNCTKATVADAEYS